MVIEWCLPMPEISGEVEGVRQGLIGVLGNNLTGADRAPECVKGDINSTNV